MKHFKFNKSNIVVFLLISVLTNALSQQGSQAQTDSLVITDIVFIGNNKTKDKVLRRELKLKIGDRFDLQQVEEDRKRIKNLRLFTRVDVQPVQTDSGIVLLYYVAERWYIFPFPILFYSERDIKKLSYGLGLLHENVAGLNQRMAASAWFGYNPGMHIYYYNPWFGGGKHFYTKASVYVTQERNKSLNYNRFSEYHKAFTLTFGKRWGYHTYLSTILSYRQIRLPEEFKELTVSNTGTDRLPSVGFSFLYDNRDLFEYPKKGWYIEVQATRAYYPHTINNFHLGVDARYYIPIKGPVSLATRFASDLAAGDTPIYSHFYLGYKERIRGHFHKRREGTNRVLSSFELRFPILKVRYFDLGSASPFLGSYGSNLPFGISGGLFYDTGAVWNKDETLKSKDFLTGFGFGLHIHLPYIELFRIEYAFDTKLHPELVLDIGVWF